MESKIVPLNPIPDHPNFLRLPSLSRSLIHSILPKACHAMHTKPLVFSVSTTPTSSTGPPQFSNRKRVASRPSPPVKISKAYNIRPNSPSYTYKKMFANPPQILLPKAKYYKLKKERNFKKSLMKTFYCEVASHVARSETTSPSPKQSLSKTMWNFDLGLKVKGCYKLLDVNEQCLESLPNRRKKTLMKNISEARSSQESSNESLKYFHIKHESG